MGLEAWVPQDLQLEGRLREAAGEPAAPDARAKRPQQAGAGDGPQRGAAAPALARSCSRYPTVRSSGSVWM